jgi:membrane protease YdiL (CAAX protease family)
VVAPADTAAPADDERSRRRLGWTGLGVASLSFLAGLVSATILGGVYGTARGLDQAAAEGDLGFAVATSVGLWVGFLGIPLLWSRRHGGPARHLGLTARWADLPLGLAAGLGSTIVTGVLSSLLLTTDQQKVLERKAETILDRGQGPGAVVLLVLVLCVFTPLAEEVFFRGLLFRSLSRVTRLGLALVIAGLVFGLVHYDGKPAPGVVLLVQIGMLGLFGLVLCALAARTGRLAAGIVAHAAFNAVTVITLLARH